MGEMRKIIGAVIGILGFIAVMAGLSYALFTFSTNNSNVVTAGHQCINITYEKGNDTSASELNFVSDYTQSPVNTTITFSQDSSCGNNVGTIYIYTNNTSNVNKLMTGLGTSGNVHGVLKYTIVRKVGSATAEKWREGYITNTGDTAVDIGALNDSTTTYTVYLWLETDTTGQVDNSVISEVSYSGYIHASARQTSSFK